MTDGWNAGRTAISCCERAGRSTDKIIDEIMDELNSEDGMPEKEVREELMKSKKKETEKDDGWYCDSGCSGRVDISADQSTDIYQGPDQ